MSWVLFFDGDCAFCSASVRWVARFDRRARVWFSPLQGELARAAGLSGHAVPGGGTMVLLREPDGRAFTRSEGMLELARALGGAWRVLTIFRLVPKGLRDRLYDGVARNRFRLMGKADTCALVDSELRKRLRE